MDSDLRGSRGRCLIWVVAIRNRRWVWLALGGLVLIGCCALLLHPNEKQQTPLRLVVVRQTLEQGKPVVYFRVEGPRQPKLQIAGVQRVVGDKVDEPVEHPLGLTVVNKDFWAPSQNFPIGDTRKARQEFGVVTPTNGTSWKLRVILYNRTTRWADIPETFTEMRTKGDSLPRAILHTFKAMHIEEGLSIESQPITNSLPTGTSANLH